MAKILIAEDDYNFAANVQDWLTIERHNVEVVHDGLDASTCLRTYSYDLVILDWNLPGKSGVEICQEFRTAGGKTPILMLTGRTSVNEKETGLDSGADDYLSKPCHARELAARVRALLRRSVHITDPVLKVGKLELDPIKWSVTNNGQSVTLRPMEFKLLEFFMKHPGQLFSPQAIFERVWDSSSEATEESIKSHVKQLRQKLDVEGQPSLIRTVRGMGYMLELEQQS